MDRQPFMDLIDAKNLAYQAWLDAKRDLPDMWNENWDKIYDTYDAAWDKYLQAKHKVQDAAHEFLETPLKEYNDARDSLIQDIDKVKRYLNKYKDNVEERASNTFFHGLDALVEAAVAARKKYNKARDILGGYYGEIHDDIVEDYQTAAQYLSETLDRLSRFSNKKISKNYKKTEAKLKESRDRAREVLLDVKLKYQKQMEKIQTFNEEITEHARGWYNWLKEHILWVNDWLKMYKNDAKYKTEKTYQQILNNIQNLSDSVVADMSEAELAIIHLKDRSARFAIDALKTIRQKYKNLKDEL